MMFEDKGGDKLDMVLQASITGLGPMNAIGQPDTVTLG